MKKLYLIIFLMLSMCLVQAQDRTCGTMTSLEDRMAKDPSLKQKHEAYEQATQEWIRTHSTTNTAPVYPAIKGFVPTGDRVQDQQNYATAKAALLSDPGNKQRSSNISKAPAKKSVSTKKKNSKSVGFQTMKGGSK
ncbi:MAG: hypothetical protein IPO39_08320 [Bacteroidetes bacterium]|jgi:hypothetical protein|nr:hypothetical protein [Bacteroidota bacterium]MBK9524748.1 hypothetical protein [Bacteroidota bacterium]MBP6648297.1 hypothetical protein [Bacteroidia bacterium]